MIESRFQTFWDRVEGPPDCEYCGERADRIIERNITTTYVGYKLGQTGIFERSSEDCDDDGPELSHEHCNEYPGDAATDFFWDHNADIEPSRAETELLAYPPLTLALARWLMKRNLLTEELRNGGSN